VLPPLRGEAHALKSLSLPVPHQDALASAVRDAWSRARQGGDLQVGEGQLVGSVLESVGSSTGALGESVGEWLGDAVSRAISQAINNVVGELSFLAGFNLLCRQGWAGGGREARIALIRPNQSNACGRQGFNNFDPFFHGFTGELVGVADQECHQGAAQPELRRQCLLP